LCRMPGRPPQSARCNINIVTSGSGNTAGDNADIQVQPGSGVLVANAGHGHGFSVTTNGANAIPTVQPTIILNQIIKT
jgi:hypothetical protein